MQAPTISIIIPCQNAKKYLDKVLPSLQSQSIDDWEALVVDNNSTDDTTRIIKDFSEKDTRIKYISQPHGGRAQARNAGLDNAIGKYIMFCDADDWFEPKMCETMLENMKASSADIVQCWTDTIRQTDRKIDFHYLNPLINGTFDLEDINTAKIKINVFLWNKIFRKSIIDEYKIRFPDDNFLDADNDLFIWEYLSHANKCTFIHDKLYNYLVREGSTQYRMSDKRMQGQRINFRLRAVSLFYHHLKEHNAFDNNREFFNKINTDAVKYISEVYSSQKAEKPLSKSSNKKILPTKVRLEACSLCQLNCRDCYMRLYNNAGVGAGYLKFTDFVKFMKLNPQVKEIELSSSGEIFLNPELESIIKYACENDIRLIASNGVNFNDVSDHMLETLVKYKFHTLVVSIDGWDQESYVQYRRNGNFDKVISNLRKLDTLKKQYSSRWPYLTWKYIIFEHNDNEQGAQIAKNLARELGATFTFSKAWNGYSPKNIITAGDFTQSQESDDNKSKTDSKGSVYSVWDIPCSQLWLSPQINWDGKFFGCCINHEIPYGGKSLFEIPLHKYFRRGIVRNTMNMLMGKFHLGKTNQICRQCSMYKSMKDSRQFISHEELSNGGRKIITPGKIRNLQMNWLIVKLRNAKTAVLNFMFS